MLRGCIHYPSAHSSYASLCPYQSVTKTSDGGLPCRGRSAGIFFKGLFWNEILFKSQMNDNKIHVVYQARWGGGVRVGGYRELPGLWWIFQMGKFLREIAILSFRGHSWMTIQNKGEGSKMYLLMTSLLLYIWQRGREGQKIAQILWTRYG